MACLLGKTQVNLALLSLHYTIKQSKDRVFLRNYEIIGRKREKKVGIPSEGIPTDTSDCRRDAQSTCYRSQRSE